MMRNTYLEKPRQMILGKEGWDFQAVRLEKRKKLQILQDLVSEKLVMVALS